MLALVCRALNDSEIAEQLSVSVSTVKNSIHSACIKLGARNRLEAAHLAIKLKALRFLDIFSFDEVVEMANTLGPDVCARVYLAVVEACDTTLSKDVRELRPRDTQLELLLRRLESLPDEKPREMTKAFIRFILEEEEKKAAGVKDVPTGTPAP